jgi:hypothetical protein
MSDGEAPIGSAAEFDDRLGSLLRRAHEDGIGVEGGWSCRNGSEVPDWDVVVTAVRKSENAD